MDEFVGSECRGSTAEATGRVQEAAMRLGASAGEKEGLDESTRLCVTVNRNEIAAEFRICPLSQEDVTEASCWIDLGSVQT
jgi:hypothetical protein